MNESDLSVIFNELNIINSSDTLEINELDFYQNKEIKKVFIKHNFTEREKNNFYMFLLHSRRLSNGMYRKNSEKLKSEIISAIVIENIKKITNERNIEYFSNIFMNYITEKITEKKFGEFAQIISVIRFPFFINTINRSNVEFISEDLGIEFEKYSLSKKTNCVLRPVAYNLTEEGKKFMKYIFIDITKKEKKIYSKLIDFNYMGEYRSAKDHKNHYDSVMREISLNENIIKSARIHSVGYKEFFEEYHPLINFVISKYNDNTIMKFCGHKTDNNIKCDGKIIVNEIEEKIEITSPFYDKNSKNEMDELNKFGMTGCRVNDYKLNLKDIVDKINNAIDKKNKKTSYDDTVTLVVFFDKFGGLFKEQVLSINFFENLFSDIHKPSNNIFKEIYILIDNYHYGNEILESRIIEII